MTNDAFAVEVVLVPLDEAGFGKLRKHSARSNENWVFVVSDGGRRYLAMDEASDIASLYPAQATMYTPIHTQLVSWWLFHAWRSADLMLDGITDLHAWRPYPAAVISRAVIEQCGCLLYESRKIAEAWAGAKTSDVPDELARINQVRSALSPLLTSAAFGTRLSAVEGRGVRATNVLTYVDKLAGLAGDAEIRKWYDWLSDAAHPACGARIAGSSDPFMHNTRAIMLRYHDRSPLHLEGPGGVTRFQYPIATHAADAIASCGSLIVRILDQMLKVVTTSASPLRPRPTPRATTGGTSGRLEETDGARAGEAVGPSALICGAGRRRRYRSGPTPPSYSCALIHVDHEPTSYLKPAARGHHGGTAGRGTGR